MSAVSIAVLVAEALAFAVWAVLMYRTLFLLRRRAVARTGQMLPGPGPVLAEIAHFVTAPGDRSLRGRLAASSTVLVALILLFALLLGR